MVHTDPDFDLAALRLGSGAGVVLQFRLASPVFTLGGHEYRCSADDLDVRVDASRTVGEGWAFKLAFGADVVGPCVRCLGDGSVHVEVESREATRPGGGEQLDSPYLADSVLDVGAWMHDALVLATPAAILCDESCRGLCPECGERLDDLPDDHAHERPPDPRWDALRRLGQ